MIDERLPVLSAVVGMHYQPGTLVHQKQVSVFIDDVQLWRGDSQIGVFLPGSLEEFVVDVHLTTLPSARRVSRSARLPSILMRLSRMYFCESEAGSRGTVLAKKRSSRCPASFFPMRNSFTASASFYSLTMAFFHEKVNSKIPQNRKETVSLGRTRIFPMPAEKNGNFFL